METQHDIFLLWQEIEPSLINDQQPYLLLSNRDFCHKHCHKAKAGSTNSHSFITIIKSYIVLSRVIPITGCAKSQKYLKVCFCTNSSNAVSDNF
jgi:hypothetical protein